ncbi:MAG: hypothetical protein LUP91_01700 [Methylococcaceae bacterium]|jgi:hypothetical protein|nr:hypothetical protein [Methylococcaceae bacterium]
MNKYIKENSFSNDKKTGGLIKQLILTIGSGIALLVFALFASGILFTGAVVQRMNSDIKENVHK